MAYMSWQAIEYVTLSAYVLTGQHPTTERRIRDDRNTQLASRAQNIRLWALDVELEKRVLDLNGRNRVYSMRTTNVFSGTL